MSETTDKKITADTIFRKVYLSERHPSDGQRHIFHFKQPFKEGDKEKWHQERTIWYKEHLEEVKRDCDWWLEEISGEEYAIAYHRQRVEGITDEMIDKHFPIDEQTRKDFPYYYDANIPKRDGIKWLKEKLLNND